MSDLNREVGEVKIQIKHLSSEVSEIKGDVKTLLKGHWRFWGAAGLAAFIATLVVEMVRASQ